MGEYCGAEVFSELDALRLKDNALLFYETAESSPARGIQQKSKSSSFRFWFECFNRSLE